MFFIFLLMWLIISMRLSVEIAVIGALISFAVYRFACRHMRYRPSTDRKILRNFFLGLQYIVLLIKEVAKANIAVFRIVFSRTIQVEPCLIYFRTDLQTNLAMVTLANSITLTPGTITVALNDGLFCVHCLDSSMADDIDNSDFVKMLRKFEKRERKAI